MNVWRSLWLGLMAVLISGLAAEAGMTSGLDQECYRWRNDDGGEGASPAGASWKAAANTPIAEVTRDANIRLRFAVSLRDSTYPADLSGRVEYSEGTTNGPWTAVGVSAGRPFQMTTTTGYANDDPTTDQLPISGLAFAGGRCVEDPANTSTTFSLAKVQYCNVEYCFRATAYAKRGTTYYFRLAKANGDYPFKYTEHARLTIENTDVPPPTDIYVDDADPNTVRKGQTIEFGAGESATNYVHSWQSCADATGAWNGGSQFSVVAIETNEVSFRWIPNVLTTAQYNVYAWWTYGPVRGMNVPYAIRHAGGTNQVSVNQRDQSLSGKWNLLGTYTFDAGSGGWIELDGNNGQACADAVRLERVGGAPLADADGDGMLDSWESTYLGGTSASPTADPDLDGMNNLQEFQAGTIPNDPKSVLAMVGVTGSGSTLDLKWLSATGKTYEIQKSTNLTEGFTQKEATNLPANPPTNSYPVAVGAGGSGFYRVKLETGN